MSAHSCNRFGQVSFSVSQEERSAFWEIILTAILSKKICICSCVLLRTVSDIELFH
jgi:hypothetical protein